ncbi:hypothetical protein BD310DRAFT_922621 [Dichomitus squalens]|uniref:Uncharacterized protein n=1 Tax=Dichomitus squalens TaxID=114155 RepID=A0A4Q9Q048_9APHY|nr:hypothetical protein BD310DRAFT_922621 [Dichomitus squalens]
MSVASGTACWLPYNESASSMVPEARDRYSNDERWGQMAPTVRRPYTYDQNDEVQRDRGALQNPHTLCGYPPSQDWSLGTRPYQSPQPTHHLMATSGPSLEVGNPSARSRPLCATAANTSSYSSSSLYGALNESSAIAPAVGVISNKGPLGPRTHLPRQRGPALPLFPHDNHLLSQARLEPNPNPYQ